MKHVMIDLETLGNKSGCVILSVAAVQFDLENTGIGESYYSNIKIQSCLDVGLTIEADTLSWWLGQDDKAKQLLASKQNPLSDVLFNLTLFFEFNNIEFVWGNSSRFDLGILENAYTASGLPVPWQYYNERDVRTLVSFAPSVKKDMPFEGVKHHGLADCLHQIRYCTAIYRKLKI